jgi:hypothetical protein
MKKNILCIVLSFLIINVTLMQPVRAAGMESNKNICNDVIITAITPALNKAISDFYKTLYKETPEFDYTSTSIVGIERPNKNRTSYFIISVEIEPYFGPHITVGKDRIQIELSSSQEPKAIILEHLKSYPLSEQYHHLYL